MLALIAGDGRLPAVLAGTQAEPPLICAPEGFAPEGLAVDIRFRIETLGSLLATLKQRGVDRICMAGGVQRPAIDPSAIDAATMPLVPVLLGALDAGDDGALRAAITIFESAGFEVVAAHAIAPALLPEPGCPTAAQPSSRHRSDALRGQTIMTALGQADVGQACVVRGGQALAVEGVFGTNWMLQSLDRRPDGRGGLLFKAPKPSQERRADLPAIGASTVAAAAAAGLDGIVIEAGGVMVLDQAQAIAECNRLGLFLWVRDRET